MIRRYQKLELSDQHDCSSGVHRRPPANVVYREMGCKVDVIHDYWSVLYVRAIFWPRS